MKNRITFVLILSLILLSCVNKEHQKQHPKRWVHYAKLFTDDMFLSDEVVRIADNLLLAQKSYGGWEKNINFQNEFSDVEKEEFLDNKNYVGATIDNDATTTEIRFLARAFAKHPKEKYQKAVLKGIDYLLEMQYDNGGWPQFYPIRDEGRHYSRHITFNDNAMTNVLYLLQDIYEGHKDFEAIKITNDYKKKIKTAIDKGIECILKTQIIVDGEPTVWCAQHDNVTLKPAGARTYELPSFSGGESVEVVQFLMNLKNPSDDVIKAVDGAIKWFEANKIIGIRIDYIKDENGNPDKVVVEDSNAPPIWARFYDLETVEPFFCSRDGIKRNNLSEISQERRGGYGWYTDAPQIVIDKYSVWKSNVEK